MNLFFKKSLVYTLTLVLGFSTWFGTGVLKTPTAQAAEPTIGDIFINEIVPSPDAGNEWLELINTKNVSFDLASCSFFDLANPEDSSLHEQKISIDLVGRTIPSRGLVTFEMTNRLNTSSDALILYCGNPAVEIARVSYGVIADGKYLTTDLSKGQIYYNGPDEPGKGESLALDFSAESLVKKANTETTKGWFNGSPTITDITTALTGQGIATNLGTNEIPDPATAAGLYFEKTGYGKVTFSGTLNLTDQGVVSMLENLSSKLIAASGKIGLDARTSEILRTAGATIEIYGIDDLGFTSPSMTNLLVKDESGNVIPIDSTNFPIISDFLYAPAGIHHGVVSFSASHFTTFELNQDLTLDNVAFTSAITPSGSPVNILSDATPNYYLPTNNDPSTHYNVQMNGSKFSRKLASADSPFGLYLTNVSADKKTELTNYYNTRAELQGDAKSAFRNYLISAVDGTEPFTRIYAESDGSAKLADGAKYELLSHQLSDMDIPGDYPPGVYTVSGQVVGQDNQMLMVTFTMIVDRTAPIAEKVTVNPNPAKAGTVNVRVDFNESMDTTVSPDVQILGIAETPIVVGKTSFVGKTWLGSTIINSADVYKTGLISVGSGTDLAQNAFIANNNAGQFILDTTMPTTTLNGNANLTVVYGSKFTDPGVTVTDIQEDGKVVDITSTALVTVTGLADTGRLGNQVINYDAYDQAGNKAATISRIVDVVLGEHQIGAAPTTTLSSEKYEVAITNDYDEPSTSIYVPNTVSNAALNVSGLLTGEEQKSAILPALSILSDTNSGTVQLAIQSGTTVTGPADWNGVITLPQIIANPSVNSMLKPGRIGKNIVEIEIGLGDTKLTFDRAVRILLPGQAGKTAGYVRNNNLTEISDICSADSQTVGDELAPERDCKINVENNLVIWTKHFTKFLAYNQEIVQAPVFSLSANDKTIKVEWQGTGAESYEVVVNNGIIHRISGTANDSGKIYSLEFTVLDYGTYTVLVRAIKSGVYSENALGKNIALSMPADTIAPAQPEVPTIAPQRAQAAPESGMTVPNDNNGVIKGDDTDEADEEEKFNWTPWIVLFVLIILAGGATSGYFYWSSRDETPIKDKRSRGTKKPAKSQKRNKRIKRW